MLGWRLLISLILIPALIGVFYADAKSGHRAPFLLALCALIAVRAAWEMVTLLKNRALELHFPFVVGCTLAVIASGWVGHLAPDPGSTKAATDVLGPIMIAFALSLLLLFSKKALRFREPGHNVETLGAELLIVGYVGVLLSVTAQLRWVAGAQAGYLVLGSLVIAAKFGDIGAYTLGRLFGRKKMHARLSPGKTWMGGVGAMAGAGLGGWAWLGLATSRFDGTWQPPEWYWSLLYGVAIGIAGLMGDLCESLIKRDAGQKDAAALLPGFGGVLDLLDSVLYAGPVAYLLWLLLPLKTW